MALTVLIVDDHEGFRRIARELLEADGVEVVGEAADGESAIAEAERLRPTAWGRIRERPTRLLSNEQLHAGRRWVGIRGDRPTGWRRMRDTTRAADAEAGPGWGSMTDHSARAGRPRSGEWFAAEGRAGMIYRSWLRSEGMTPEVFDGRPVIEYLGRHPLGPDRKSTRLNSSHVENSYAVFCLKNKHNQRETTQ